MLGLPRLKFADSYFEPNRENFGVLSLFPLGPSAPIPDPRSRLRLRSHLHSARASDGRSRSSHRRPFAVEERAPDCGNPRVISVSDGASRRSASFYVTPVTRPSDKRMRGLGRGFGNIVTGVYPVPRHFQQRTYLPLVRDVQIAYFVDTGRRLLVGI